MSKLTRQNYEGFARMMADLRPDYQEPISSDQRAAFAQWQRTMHALCSEMNDQAARDMNGNRNFDQIRFINKVVKLSGGEVIG